MPDIPLDAVANRQSLHELAQELAPDGAAYTLIVVGGSLLALHGLRDSTADVAGLLGRRGTRAAGSGTDFSGRY